jgi:hypothetical protein
VPAVAFVGGFAGWRAGGRHRDRGPAAAPARRAGGGTIVALAALVSVRARTAIAARGPQPAPTDADSPTAGSAPAREPLPH